MSDDYQAEDVALEVMARFPEYRHWYMAGHSMGRAMASQFASDHPDEVDGLILLGAYIYGDYPEEDTLTIYGSLNQSVEDNIDYTENVVEIQGGNHARFGNYGPQGGTCPRRSPPRNSRSRRWRPLKPSWHKGIRSRKRSTHGAPLFWVPKALRQGGVSCCG